MRLRVAIAIVALVGLGIAVYLTTVHYEHVAPICTSGGCEKVQRSSYAELAGIPVAVLGLIGYVLLLATVGLRGTGAALAGAFVALTGHGLQRLPALGAAGADPRHLHLVRRQRHRDGAARGALLDALSPRTCFVLIDTRRWAPARR